MPKPMSPLLERVLDQINTLDAEIADREEALKQRKAYKRYLAENVLAEVVTAEDLNDGALMPDGTVVMFDRAYFASIKSEDKEAAHQWLVEHGHGDLLKTRLTIDFPKGMMPLADALMRVCEAFTVEVETNVTTELPGPTLKKWAREAFQAGQDVPAIFGLFAPIVPKLAKGK